MSNQDHAARLREIHGGSMTNKQIAVKMRELANLFPGAASALKESAELIDRMAVLERELAEARKVLEMVETECRADESQMVRDFVDSHVKPILEVSK